MLRSSDITISAFEASKKRINAPKNVGVDVLGDSQLIRNEQKSPADIESAGLLALSVFCEQAVPLYSNVRKKTEFCIFFDCLKTYYFYKKSSITISVMLLLAMFFTS